MLYVFLGETRDKWLGSVKKLRQKNPSADFFSASADELNLSRLEESLVGQVLFAKKFIVSLDGVWADERAQEIVTANLEAMASSANVYLWFEFKLPAEIVKKIKKFGGTIEEVKKEKGEGKKVFNVFALGDTLGNKDRLKFWLLLQEANQKGLVAEEIFWAVQWKVKTLLLVKQTKKLSDLKLHPYALQIAERQAGNFTLDELRHLSGRLVDIFHSSRWGETDLPLALEKLALEI